MGARGGHGNSGSPILRQVSGARGPPLGPLAAAWLLGPPASLLLVDSVHAVYSSRYLSFAVPGAALLIVGLLCGRSKQIIYVQTPPTAS